MAGRQFCQQSTFIGYVEELYPKEKCFKLRLRSCDETGYDVIYAYVNSEVSYRPLPNLKGSHDRYGTPEGFSDSPQDKLEKYLALGLLVLVEGVFYRDHLQTRMEVRTVYLLYDQKGKPITEYQGDLVFEETRWWLNMIIGQGNTWFRAFFADRQVDFARYRTELNEVFQPKSEMQEVAVLSRLLYGYSVTYQLTGQENYLTALREGVKYQREIFRHILPDGKSVLWYSYHDGKDTHLPSNNGDDNGTIPLYEQIYALAGLTMYYRITGDTEALKDILGTIHAFQKYFLDHNSEFGGYFSHIDPATLSPTADCLQINQAKKNWNSVGDHIPAYLINLICALMGKPEFDEERKLLHGMLMSTTSKIIKHFPQEDSSLVAERFHQDWTVDKTYTWQQDRGIIGHNLKIAWNLTRIAFYLESCEEADHGMKEQCLRLARKLANAMDELGGVDKFRGGCYDAVERCPDPDSGMKLMFPWLNTKDFWQQEQGILCYLILMGASKDECEFQKFRELATVMSSFYFAFFVDMDQNDIHFRVTDIGVPVKTGQYADKGGHAKSGYHIFELCYLAFMYTALYNKHTPFTLHFAPVIPTTGELKFSICPDFLPKDAIDFDMSHVQITRSDMVKVITRKLKNFTICHQFDPSEAGKKLQVQVTLHPKKRRMQEQKIHASPRPHVCKGKIAVVLESHFDEKELYYLNKMLPKQGFILELVSKLWGQDSAKFQGNECLDAVRVFKDFKSIKLDDYVAFFFVGGYCMDRLRYQVHPKQNEPNKSEVVELVRKLARVKKTTATICHSLWAFVCAPEVISKMKVTCAHNIIDDVQNAGGTVMYERGGTDTVEVYEDDWLISGKHPGYVEQVIERLIDKLNRDSRRT